MALSVLALCYFGIFSWQAAAVISALFTIPILLLVLIAGPSGRDASIQNSLLEDATAAICYLDIKQSLLVRADWFGRPLDMIFLLLENNLVAEFNPDTLLGTMPDIESITPTRIAVDYLPTSGVCLCARPASNATIRTERREALMFEDTWGIFIHKLDELDEVIVQRDGDPPLFELVA